MKTSELTGVALDWAVAKCEDKNGVLHDDGITRCIVIAAASGVYKGTWKPTINWSQGGPIIEQENITLIRANDQYIEGKNIPLWFAETDKWVGHNITAGYEGEYFDPCFMVDEAGGCYGPTPLIAAMRAYVARKLGNKVEIPEELL